MSNIELAIGFLGFFLAWGTGFIINAFSSSTSLQRRERHWQLLILSEVITMAIIIGMLLLKATFWYPLSFFPYLLLLHVLFFLLIFLNWKKGRCWRQHRMLFYTFFSIPLLYFLSESLMEGHFFALVVLSYLYLVSEFQFAAFSFQRKWWD